jgi:hypothetical protein
MPEATLTFPDKNCQLLSMDLHLCTCWSAIRKLPQTGFAEARPHFLEADFWTARGRRQASSLLGIGMDQIKAFATQVEAPIEGARLRH